MAQHLLILGDGPACGRIAGVLADANPDLDLLSCLTAEAALRLIGAREELGTTAAERLPLFALLDFDALPAESLDLLDRLRGHPRFRFIPVVLYAACADPVAIGEAIARGARGCIPGDEPELFDRRLVALCRYWRVINWPELWTVPRDLRTLSRLLVLRRREAGGYGARPVRVEVAC